MILGDSMDSKGQSINNHPPLFKGEKAMEIQYDYFSWIL